MGSVDVVGLVAGDNGAKVLGFVLPEVVWQPRDSSSVWISWYLAEDDFFEGQARDSLRFRIVAKAVLRSMDDHGVDTIRISGWRSFWSSTYQWHPVWHPVIDPDVGEVRNYHWSRYDGVWYTWHCRHVEPTLTRIHRWYALCVTRTDSHWYSYVPGMLRCPLCRHRRERMALVQRENLQLRIYVPSRADSVVCDEDMDSAEAAYQKLGN